MRRRDRQDLRRRLSRLESARGGDLCICPNPLRIAGPSDQPDEACAECGGELIVVLVAFDPGDDVPALERLAATGGVGADGRLDLTRLGDDELAELKRILQAGEAQ